jgi:hypothetical protein
MDGCTQHKDLSGKVTQLCLQQVRQEEQLKHLGSEYAFIKDEIFEGPNSIKTRIANTEVGLVDLKETVLENRRVVGEQIKAYQEDISKQLDEHKKTTDGQIKGLFRIFILAMTASFLILGSILSFLTIETRNTNQAITDHVLSTAVNQSPAREPSPSPMLPFKESKK